MRNVWYFNKDLLICWFIYRELLLVADEIYIGCLTNHKFQGFLTILLPQSNVSFWRWFELHGFFLLDIPSCIFNQNVWICFYEWLDGSNYYPETSFTTKAAITLFYKKLESNLSPWSSLCHYESQSSNSPNSCIAVVW